MAESASSHNDPQVRLDGMCIFIEKNKEAEHFADYFFVCDAYAKDPRFKSRHMLVGQRRGLFRIDKTSMNVELLYPMELDDQDRCFARAAGKILQLYESEGTFPERAQFASG